MYCKYCGSKTPENSKFCQSCGAKVENIVVQPGNIPNIPMNNIPANNNIPMMPTKKSGNPILLLVLIVFGICAIAIPLFLRNKDVSSEKESSNNVNNNTNIENNNTTNNTTNPVTPSTDTTAVQYNGYTFYIPNEYFSMEYEGSLTVYDETATWLIMFSFNDASFTELKGQIDVLDILLAEDYENPKSTIKTYQGQEYILTTFTSDGDNMQMIMTDVNGEKTLLTLLMPIDSSVSFDKLFNIAFPIATNVK